VKTYSLKNLLLTFKALLLQCLIPVAAFAQQPQISLLNIGDPAPPLQVREWIKGTPVPIFEKGRVYVLEFWATWCRPCIAAMAELSVLAREYKDKVTFIGVDVYEGKIKSGNSITKLKSFVDSMGSRIYYPVAVEDSGFTVAEWLGAADEKGIPKTFVVDAEGRLAWIGYPKELNIVLSKIVKNDWNIKEALNRRNELRRLAELDKAANDTLYSYMVTPSKQDSAMFVINSIIENEPKLKYAPFMAFNTFSTLLKIDPHKAYEYGKEVLSASIYEEPSYDEIIMSIRVHSKMSKLPAEIYQIGAEAYQMSIDYIPYPEIADIDKYYNNMADWYWRANNKSEAVKAMQKAIEVLKSKKGFSKTDLAKFESQLQRYKKL
jgi:thiol-disulfide isomerase/thioredoxin